MKVSNLFNGVRLESIHAYQQVEVFHSAQNLIKVFIGLAIVLIATPSIAQDANLRKHEYPEHFRLKNMEDGSYLTNVNGNLQSVQLQDLYWINTTWKFNQVPKSPAYYRIENPWNGEVIHNHGGLKVSQIPIQNWSSLWERELVHIEGKSFIRLKNMKGEYLYKFGSKPLNAGDITGKEWQRTVLWEVVPVDYMRIKCMEGDNYLNLSKGLDASEIRLFWNNAQWGIEETGDNKNVRIINKHSAQYLNIKNNKLVVSDVQSDLENTLWKKELVGHSHPSYVRLKNVKKGTYIFTHDGGLQVGNISGKEWWKSVMWTINDVLPPPEAWIPTFHFDGSAGDKCFPTVPNEANNGKCHSFNKNAPVFWEGQYCSDTTYKLAYWLWYGWQHKCIDGPAGNSTTHGNDWEHITLNFEFDYTLGKWSLISVTYYQHSGWYTRAYEGGSVHVYVGKIGHGSYHNSCDGIGVIWDVGYCQGGCGYWDDFRNPTTAKWADWTPTHLLPLSHVKKQNLGAISDRVKNEDYCTKGACKGINARLLTESGCWQNNSSPFK